MRWRPLVWRARIRYHGFIVVLPSEPQIIALHHKYAPSDAVFEIVYGHCQIVWAIAQQLLAAKPQALDLDLLEAGCLLHDIGAYRFYQADGTVDEAGYVGHGPMGSALLEREGVAAELCGIAARHTGVGVTKAEILKHRLPLPPADYLAGTIEERLVMYADKFHSKPGPADVPSRFNSFEAYSRHVSRFGPEKVAKFNAFRDEFGLPDLAVLSVKHHQPIV